MNWIGHSEIDEYAKTIYEKHFPESEDLGDVRTVDLDRIPEGLDLITFGFPCQDLSIAGKRGGIEASRSGLFFEAMRIIRIKRPKYFIFENVSEENVEKLKRYNERQKENDLLKIEKG